MTDMEVLIAAIEKAGVIIAEYLEPGYPSNDAGTIQRLIEALDTQEVAAAVDRLKSGFGLKVVK